MSAAPERLAVSFAHAGELLDVSARTVRRIVASKELPVVVVAGRKRIPYAALKAYAERECPTGAKAPPSGGSLTQRQAARELENLLGPLAEKKPRHLRLVKGSKRTG